jgi:hypothetical protein
MLDFCSVTCVFSADRAFLSGFMTVLYAVVRLDPSCLPVTEYNANTSSWCQACFTA